MAKKKLAPTPDTSFTGDPPTEAHAPEAPDAEPIPAEEEDPVEAAERAAALAALPELAEEDLRMIRGLWHNERQIAAMRHYRRLATQEDGSELPLNEVKRIVEAIVAAGPAPEGFELPSAEEAPPSIEEQVVYAADPAYAAHQPGGEVINLPNRPDLKVVAAEPLRGKKVLRTVMEDRRFVLDDRDFHTKAIALATTIRDIAVEEARQAQVKRDLKAMLGKLEEQREKLAAELRDNCEVRPVRVVYEADYDGGLIREIDEATGEVLAEKPLSGTADAQVPLFGGKAAPSSSTAGAERDEGEDWPEVDGDEDAPDEAAQAAEDDEAEDADFASRCRTLIARAEDLPEAAASFAAGVIETLGGMADTFERIGTATDTMVEAADNIENGIAGWEANED